ncbi:MAG TPA: HlyD family efflux transporter periplasmic adaptor subunit [Rhodocyclaceae bacterium]|nr:HlyD family efflux transporter periplasmic adaptor subunit [Rhodocyclaceae bacterium]
MKRVHIQLMSLALLLAACGQRDADTLNGYVETEPVRVASPVGGRLLSLAVQRGDEVKAGMPLFVLEQDNEAAGLRAAQARVEQAEAQVSDLAKGKRSDELAQIAAGLEAARAAARESASILQRQRTLAQQGFVSGADLVNLEAKRDADAAQVRQFEAQLRTARLPARSDNRDAARAEAAAAKAQLAQSAWQLSQKAVAAPVAARVDDTLYRVGEWVPAGSPVVSLQERAAVKLRFFVPQAQLSAVQPGSVVEVSCDGCGAPMQATVSYIAHEAEFTPPVIYSKESRQQLVFLVEARPAAQDVARLHAGQPVDVRLSVTASK